MIYKETINIINPLFSNRNLRNNWHSTSNVNRYMYNIYLFIYNIKVSYTQTQLSIPTGY